MNEQEKTYEISLGLLLTVLRHSILWLLIAAVVGAGAAFGFTKLLISPIYSSAAQFAVENTSAQAGVMNSGYQTGAVQYAANYANEVKGNVFLNEILTAYNQKFDKDMTLKELVERVSTSSDSSLPVFTVRVSSVDRQEAYDILQVIEENAPTLLLNESTKTYANIKLIEYGHLAESPDSPNTVMNTAIGGVLAVVIVYVICFLKAFLDKTVYDEEMLKSTCNLPVLGQIPSWSSRKRDAKKLSGAQFDNKQGAKRIDRDYGEKLLGKETPFSIAESFRTLRTNLTYVPLKVGECPVFAVTSGFAGAGKSLVIANVAISFAQLGKKVLLIDADMRCPTQHKIFAISGEGHGLSEALAGIEEKPFENGVVKGVREGLDLMTCGHIPPNPSELLASERMEALLNEAKSLYDYVLIDLPPLLETADAGVITKHVSAYIIVIRAGYSKIDAVKQVVNDVQGMRANVAGFVLNDVNARGTFGYYSHYSSYSKYGKYTYRPKDDR